jgi:WD40 repeat protein
VDSNGSDIYAADVSRSDGMVKTIVTGGNEGHIKLFRFPCVGDKANFTAFIGHSSHVKNLTFSQDNQFLLSLGGHDCCVFQWRYIPKFPDRLPSPSNDAELRVLAHRLSRAEKQLRRRAGLQDDSSTVRLVLDYETGGEESERDSFERKIKEEITRLLPVDFDRIDVDFLTSTSTPLVDVTFRRGPGDVITPSRTLSLQLIDEVTSTFPSHALLRLPILKNISSACLMDSPNVAPTIRKPGSGEGDEPVSNKKDGDEDSGGTEQPKLPFRLELGATMGYAGGSCLRNLRFLASGQFVYSVGSVVVIGDEKDPSQRFFTAHADEVSCLEVHPDGIKVVSADAGVAPTVLVWDSDTMKELARIEAMSEDVVDGQPCIGSTTLFARIESLAHRSALTKDMYMSAAVQVDDAEDAHISPGTLLRIEREAMCVLEVKGNVLRCKRACLGTSADTHSIGTRVEVFPSSLKHVKDGGISAVQI